MQLANNVKCRATILTQDALHGFLERAWGKHLSVPLERVGPCEKRLGLLHEPLQIWWEICEAQRVGQLLERKGGYGRLLWGFLSTIMPWLLVMVGCARCDGWR